MESQRGSAYVTQGVSNKAEGQACVFSPFCSSAQNQLENDARSGSSLNFLLLTFSYAKRLHPKNCLGVRQFAETMMCALLYDAANSFIHQHFVEVSMSEEFLALPLEDVLELVSRDELNVKSEEQVCRAESAGDMGGCCSFSSLEKVKQKTVQIVVCVPHCCLWVHFIIPSAHFMRTFFPHILASK